MKNRMKATIELNEGISVNTGLRYYKKLGKDIAKAKKRDLTIQRHSKFIKIGKIENIKIESFTKQRLTLSMDVKTHFDLSTEGKELKFGFLYDRAKRNNDKLKFKDIIYSSFYLIDSDMEELLILAKKKGVGIKKEHEGDYVDNSHLTLDEIIFS